jgi:hypothetical protein
MVFPGHVGTIYAAASATYVGRGTPSTLILAPDGTTVSNRMLSKVRNEDKGIDYGTATLVRHGAPPRRPGASGAAYVRRALREGPFRRLRHPGNHCYLFPLGNTVTRRRLRNGWTPRLLPYPKQPDPMRRTWPSAGVPEAA